MSATANYICLVRTPTARHLRLLSLLQTRRDWPGALLADRLEVSHRTIRRDVDRLRDMGYNIQATMGPEGGYRLEAGAELPPLLFDDDQVVALALALQTASATGVDVGEPAARALATVRQLMPSRLRHRLDALPVTAGGPETDLAGPDVLSAISRAVHHRHVLRFDYARRVGSPESADSRSTASVPDVSPPRRVEPHHLLTARGRWYLVAWDLERDDWRIFRADRMSPRVPTGPQFTRRDLPTGDPASFVAARFKGSTDSDTWPCRGKVILDLPARDVAPFAGDGTVEELDFDCCSVELGSWSWIGMAASLNRFDCSVEVVYPAELGAAFGVLAARNAATADSSGGPDLPSGPVPSC